MDQGTLVSDGQKLVGLLDQTPAKPRFAMWVNFSDPDNWKLWIVPALAMKDKQEFYMTVAGTVAKNRDVLPGFDAGAVEFAPDDKPLVEGVQNLFRVPDLDSVDVSGNLLNGIFLPDGILLRSNL